VRATFEAAAISELARRTLRSTEVTFQADKGFSADIESLSTSLSDVSPTLMISISHIEIDSESITIDCSGLAGGMIGCEEPEQEFVWINGNVNDIWRKYIRVMIELANAGYPGCVGCAGPAAEMPWDETLSRRRLS